MIEDFRFATRVLLRSPAYSLVARDVERPRRAGAYAFGYPTYGLPLLTLRRD